MEQLLAQLDDLVAAGNTVIIVEHDMRVASVSDWLIDIGPGAGDEGGQIIYNGPPAGLINLTRSRTALTWKNNSTSPQPVSYHAGAEVLRRPGFFLARQRTLSPNLIAPSPPVVLPSLHDRTTTRRRHGRIRRQHTQRRASMAVAPVKRKPSESSRLRAAAVRASKIDAIANRRASAAKMEKAEFIAEIVKGRFKPITAEEIAAEPTPPKEA